jgi:CO/xanthine dehydrogenase FAD-binding subunit
LPPSDGRTRAVYRKLRRRGSFDFPVLGVAAAARLRADGVVEEVRLFVTGTGSRPHAASAVARLVGHRLTDEDLLREVAAAAAQVAKPLDNTDFVMGWRKEMARQYVAAALAALGDGKIVAP